MKTSRNTCLAIATLLTLGSVARAESPLHIDDLAAKTERQARQVLYQTYGLQAYGPAARELKEDAFQMIRLASHLHDVAHVDHRHGGHGRHHGIGWQIERQRHINHDVVELDRLMHKMQDTVEHLRLRTVTRRPVHGHHAPGRVGVSVGRYFTINISSQGGGHHRHSTSYRAPSTLDRIQLSLASLSETVHHLLEDSEVVCVGRR